MDASTVTLFLVVVFLVVLGYLVSRLVGIVFGAIGAGIIMGLVPLVLDKILGIHVVPFTVYNTLMFFVLGVMAFLAYEAAKTFFGISALVGKIALLPVRIVARIVGFFLPRKKRDKKRKSTENEEE